MALETNVLYYGDNLSVLRGHIPRMAPVIPSVARNLAGLEARPWR